MAKIDPFQKSLKVKKKLIKGKDVIVVEGAMSLTSRPLKFSVPVEHPAHFAAAEFSLLLKKHGIKHEGKILFNQAQGEHQLLATHSSCSLFDMTRKMLKTNNDLYANSLIKKIGRFRFGKPGTWPNGCQAVREFLMQIVSKDLGGAVIVDGSGESSFNRISSETISLYLRHLQHKFVYAPELMACMPISGVDGCFKKKFKQKPFFSKLRGFSFTLKEDACLCGYLITRSQESLAFCLMSKQLKPFQESCAHEIEERICETLFKYTKG
jgi:D-alanyl-D-alanine carboxypeptidase/D-alanyl-D-alanine-endopeptidase (penicillin-binding protein 4)